MIERQIIEFVAAADYTDDCRVRVEMKKRTVTMTVAEARAFRAELDTAIGEASRAADDLLRGDIVPLRADVAGLGPDCRDGKHRACDGSAWDEARDEVMSCRCECHGMPWSVPA